MPRFSRFIVPLSIVGLVATSVAAVGLAVRWSAPGTAPTTQTDIVPAAQGSPDPSAADTEPSTRPATSPTPTTPPVPASPATEAPATTPVLAGHGAPYGTVDGLTMFRGNPTRSWYGRGPVPADPTVRWQFPPGEGRLCSESTAAEETKRWCGTGWTGQPVVWNRPDGVTEMIVGAYDRRVHFLDAATGEPTRQPFVTGDLIKGTPTLDPDGFPLLYVGSRDNRYRILALDRDVPTELFALTPHPQGVWNNDWDGNGVVVDGVLYLGGEDSWFRAVDLRRSRDAEGLVQVDPVVLAEAPGFDDQLFDDLGDGNVSIESSPLVVDDVVYVVNSGGLVSGFDISGVRDGVMPRVFRYWLGDDADATLVAGPDGLLYAAVEYERGLARARDVGQLVALDPGRDGDPRVWGIPVPPRTTEEDGDGGFWATPAIHGDHLYVTTHPGDLLVVDRHSGATTYEERIGYHEWSSPVVVDDVLVVALCEAGGLRGYGLADPARPVELWEVAVPTGSCIESTPAVWEGGLYVGSRDGRIYGFGDGPGPSQRP